MHFVQKTGEVGTDETGTTKNEIRHILQFQIIYLLIKSSKLTPAILQDFNVFKEGFTK